MKLGITVPRFVTARGDAGIADDFASIARDADRAGLDSLWVMDHFFQIPMIADVTEPMLEGYSALSFAAGITERISLGTLVTGVTYRHPGILIKTVTTLDVLSQGRAWLGIGAGWFEREHDALGVPFPPTAERFERLEETVQIANQMWSGNDGPYQGRHYELQETICQPMPVSRPRPRIMIAGGGEQKTLRLVARYADACNLFANPADEDFAELRHKLDVLRAHCETEQRDFADIEITVIAPAPSRLEHPMLEHPVTLTADAAHAFINQLADFGVDHVIVPVVDRESFDLVLEEVVPRLHLVPLEA